MARIFSEGAEFGDTYFVDGGSTSASTAQKRSGAYSFIVGETGAFSHSVVSIASFYLRVGFYGSAVGASNRAYVWWRNGTTKLGGVGLDLTQKPTAFVSTSVVATGTHAYAADTWHLIEVYVNIADSGTITVYVDGISEITYSGDTKPGAETGADNIQFYGVAGTTYFDDLAMDDSTWCGDGHIELLKPVTGGTYAWTGSDGDSVDNYALIDDTPSNGDTDYIKSSTASQQDLHALADFTGTGKIVKMVWAEARAKDNDGTSGQIKLGVNSNGTPSLSSAITLSSAYTKVIGDYLTLNPDDSGAWEDADLDALKLLIECE